MRSEERSGQASVQGAPAPWRSAAIMGAFAAVIAAAGWSLWRAQPRVPAAPLGEAPAAETQVDSSTEGPPAPEWEPEGPVLMGRVTAVTDGDSIHVALDSGPMRVRLHAVDAPERDQPGGPAAKAALVERLVPAEVALEPVEQDQYGRMVAVVYQDDENVNAWLVHRGHAWVYRQYARDPRYCEAELAARGARRGVWGLPAADQRAPWEWRAVKRNRRAGYSDYSGETLERCVAALGKRPEAVAPPLPMPDVSAASVSETEPGKCRIKGNIGSSGKIYHVPGTAAYEKTRIDESKGERWFCTEEEARTAGWRKPRG